LSPALLGSALLLLAATLGCNVIISGFAHDDQHETTAKETPMKVTKKARLRKIGKIATRNPEHSSQRGGGTSRSSGGLSLPTHQYVPAACQNEAETTGIERYPDGDETGRGKGSSS
jgi:hypothetical protein